MILRTWLSLLVQFINIPTCNSSWRLPAPLQAVLDLDIKKFGNTNPLRFHRSTNCTLYLEDLRSSKLSAYNWGANDAIVYNFGLDEEKSGARQLVNCLRRNDASDIRAKLREIHVAAPVVGTPNSSQNALLDLIGILPNLELVSY
jgi:hypothetical protein